MNARLATVPLTLALWVALGAAAAAQSVAGAQRVQTVRLRPLALSGELAPGVGTPFVGFVTPFGFADATAPRVDADGNAGVFATLVDPQDPTQVTSGLWRWRAATGALELIALRGDVAPTGDVFEAFPHPYFEEPPQMHAGIAGFAAATPGADREIWTDRGGALERIVRAGDPLPGGPAGEVFLSPAAEHFADGSVLVSSRWSGAAWDEGFWRDREGTLELVVRAGSPAPGMGSGVVFGDADSLHLQGPFDRWEADSAGRIAFNGTVSGPGVSITSDEGLWIEVADGVLELALKEGDPAPGPQPGFRFGVGSGVRAFGGSSQVALRHNERGTLLFGAQMHGNGSDYVDALWRRTGDGALELIAATAAGHGGYSGMQQPGTGGPFLAFASHAALNDDDRVAFQDVIQHPLNTQYNLETAIFWDVPGELELLVATETWIPGLQQGELVNSMKIGELLDDGSLWVLAEIKDASQTNERALLLFDPKGGSRVLAREGAQLDVAGDGSDLRTVVDLGVAGSGGRRFGLRADFADGTSGLFRLDLAPAVAQQPR